MAKKLSTLMERQHICKSGFRSCSGTTVDPLRQDKYIPPKRNYSLEAMLGDILDFAATSLVDGGRLSLWMPTANDEEAELGIPKHAALELTFLCVQAFNKCMSYLWNTLIKELDRFADFPTGSRRLLTYRRLPDAEVREEAPKRPMKTVQRATASDLNAFRRRVSRQHP